jgi:hypothetical protein
MHVRFLIAALTALLLVPPVTASAEPDPAPSPSVKPELRLEQLNGQDITLNGGTLPGPVFVKASYRLNIASASGTRYTAIISAIGGEIAMPWLGLSPTNLNGVQRCTFGLGSYCNVHALQFVPNAKFYAPSGLREPIALNDGRTGYIYLAPGAVPFARSNWTLPLDISQRLKPFDKTMLIFKATNEVLDLGTFELP